METFEQPRFMQSWSDRMRSLGQRIGLVPTMGYLHEGHLSLVEVVRRRADRCVVSIFVNPLQFGANEDLDHYPRDLSRDTALLREAGVDVLYLPSPLTMYPQGFQSEVSVTQVTRGMCGRSRPTHFRGVTTVVTKLFNAVKPHVAVFGEKDFQQLVTIKRMAADLDFDIEILGAPIAREADGLAMSSRNANLSPAERRAATCLFEALTGARAAVRNGERSATAILDIVRTRLAHEALARIDYVELTDPVTLEPVSAVDPSALLALAVFFGNTRLIDNTVLKRTQ